MNGGIVLRVVHPVILVLLGDTTQQKGEFVMFCLVMSFLVIATHASPVARDDSIRPTSIRNVYSMNSSISRPHSCTSSIAVSSSTISLERRNCRNRESSTLQLPRSPMPSHFRQRSRAWRAVEDDAARGRRCHRPNYRFNKDIDDFLSANRGFL